MLSNELHITRANYEEFFLLYVDGELTAAQSDAVEAFVAQHPDLQEELDLLLTTKLDAEPVFFNKEALMADNMKHLVIDESLLLYIDDELSTADKAAVEAKLEKDVNYQHQHSLLLRAKLPVEVISYPDKTELYRKEERTVRPILWYRIAAAIFVLMSAGYLWSLSDKATPDTDVAVQLPATKKTLPTPSSVDQVPVSTLPSVVAATPVETIINNTISTNREVEPGSIASSREAIASRSVVRQPAALTAPRVNVPEVKHITNTKQEEPQIIARVEDQQQILNKQPVTDKQSSTYINKIVTDEQPAVSTAVAIETDNNKRGSVKGFLRKATRFIERRTGVVATNDDNELLIGALAINLK